MIRELIWSELTDQASALLTERFHVTLPGAEHRRDVLTEEGEASLCRICALRLMYLHWPLIRRKMTPYLQQINPLASISTDLVDEAEIMGALRYVLQDLDRAGKEALYAEYPVLPQLEDLLCDKMKRLADRICENIRRQREQIAADFFSGKDFGRIIHISPTNPKDAHSRPGGGMPLFITAEHGKFLFKPSDISPHVVFAQIMNAVFPELGKEPAVLIRGDSSFMEYIPAEYPETDEEIRAYSYNSGLESALFFALLSEDMNGRNFIPQKNRPVPIDLEYLLPCPHDSRANSIPKSVERLLCIQEPERSVLGVQFGDGKTVYDEPDMFLSGFAHGYRRIMEQRDTILAILKQNGIMILRAQNLPVTLIFTILHDSVRPGCLRSADARESYLQNVGAQLSGSKEKVDWDLYDFRHLDAPYFYMRAADCALYRSDGTIVVKDYGPSPLEITEKNLARLSEEELAASLEEIEQAMEVVWKCGSISKNTLMR